MNTKLETAIENMRELATRGHAGQFRKGGNVPYVEHPKAVVGLVEKWGAIDLPLGLARAIAWGHDLLEDTCVAEEDIRNAGGEYGEAIYKAIEMLSFRPPKCTRSHAEYDAAKSEYINTVARTAPIEVLIVKMADRLCNTIDFAKAGNPWGRNYLALGACLFARIDEFPNAAAIRATYEEVEKMVSVL